MILGPDLAQQVYTYSVYLVLQKAKNAGGALGHEHHQYDVLLLVAVVPCLCRLHCSHVNKPSVHG